MLITWLRENSPNVSIRRDHKTFTKTYTANLFSRRHDGLDKNKRKNEEETRNASAACCSIRLRRNNGRGMPSVFLSHAELNPPALIWQLYLMPREDDESNIFSGKYSMASIRSRAMSFIGRNKD